MHAHAHLMPSELASLVAEGRVPPCVSSYFSRLGIHSSPKIVGGFDVTGGWKTFRLKRPEVNARSVNAYARLGYTNLMIKAGDHRIDFSITELQRRSI